MTTCTPIKLGSETMYDPRSDHADWRERGAPESGDLPSGLNDEWEELGEQASDVIDTMKIAAQDWYLSPDEAEVIDEMIAEGKGKPSKNITKLPLRNR